jgi:hypothetical protein
MNAQLNFIPSDEGVRRKPLLSYRVHKKAILKNKDGVFTYKRTNSKLKYIYKDCSLTMREEPSLFFCLMR